MTKTSMSLKNVVLATHNSGKIAEMEDLLKPCGLSVASARDYALPEPEETGESFEENAALKARAAAKATGLPALAEDSGLCVNALGGQPGIYSARWAGPDKDYSKAMQDVRDLLGDSDDWSSLFVAVMALVRPDGTCESFKGRCDGVLVWPPRGDQGFGYDPMFVPDGETRTFAEMTANEKYAHSHRARAIHALQEHIAGL